MLAGFFFIVLNFYGIKESAEEKQIIDNGKIVYSVITYRFCGFKSSYIEVVYKDVKDNIFITGDSCHSDSYTEGNLYPVKYLEGKKQLVATWENVNTMFWLSLVFLVIFSFCEFWLALALLLNIFPNNMHKIRSLYYKIDQPFNNSG